MQPRPEPVEPEQRNQAVAPASTQQAKDELDWSELAYALELDSVARQLVLNSIVDSYADHRLQLAFLAELEVMLKQDLERQIKQAFEHKLGVSLSLELRSVPFLEVETPYQASLRKLEQQRQSMIRAIHEDPVVQQLKSVFGAELVENSVKKLVQEPIDQPGLNENDS